MLADSRTCWKVNLHGFGDSGGVCCVLAVVTGRLYEGYERKNLITGKKIYKRQVSLREVIYYKFMHHYFSRIFVKN